MTWFTESEPNRLRRKLMAIAVAGAAAIIAGAIAVPLGSAIATQTSAEWYGVLFAISAAFLLAGQRIFKSRINPGSVFFGAWCIQFGLLALPLFDYYEDRVRPGDGVYIIGALICAAVGFWLGARLSRSRINRDASEPRAWGRVGTIALALGILGISGQLAGLLDASAATGFSITERIFGGVIDQVRQMHFEALEAQRRGFLALASSTLAPLSYAYLVLAFLYRPITGRRPRILNALTVVSFALIAVNSLFSYGGRLGIVLAVLLVLAATVAFRLPSRQVAVRPLGRRIRTALLVAGIAAVSLYFATGFLAERSLGVSPQRLLEQHRAALQPPTAAIAERDSAAGLLLVSLNYFSSPTPTLVRYLQLPDGELPGPYGGLYSFHLLSRPVAAVVTGEPAQGFFDMREEIFWELTNAGFAGNVWATGMRDLLVDFGKAGALVVLFLMALAGGAVFARAERPTASILGRALACFVLVGLAWFPFHLLTTVNLYFVPTVALAALVIAEKLLAKAWLTRAAGRAPISHGPRELGGGL